jgi:hypothetical protein
VVFSPGLITPNRFVRPKELEVLVSRTHLLPLSFLLSAILTVAASAQISGNTQQPAQDPATSALKIDPRLIAQAHEVWALIGSPGNPIWAGWDASSTPLLLYIPGEQDVLINHPHPPQGFVAYNGPIRFPGWRIWIKNGPTLMAADGQNTSLEVEGVPTLAVADTLSNLRNKVASMVTDPRPADQKLQTLHALSLATDPYDQLALVTHEAFHVFQGKQAPDKGANEMALLHYPVLSVQNNVGFALEGLALADALHAKDDAQFRRAALRWLAVRKDRRASLPAEAVEYEDGTEYNEGLATYTQYRLFQALEGRQPGSAMAWVQGFAGYADLGPQREDLIATMIQNMKGNVPVNGDPYGTAPLRMRLYYSGMAEGVLLDRLSPGWKSLIFAPDASLTALAEEALKPAPSELDQSLKEAKVGAAYDALVQDKTRLAEEGKGRAEAAVQEIETGPGIALIVDYSKLASSKLGMGFTPFGITAVDEDRTIFAQVPIKVIFGPAGELTQNAAQPLLRDTGKKLIRFRMLSNATRADVEKILGSTPTNGDSVAHLALDLPGASLKAARAQVSWREQDLLVTLLESDEKK